MVHEKDSITAWSAQIATVKSDAKGAAFWAGVKRLLEKPRRSRVSVNLNKLSRLAKDGEYIVVPGKVLAFGKLERKFKIAAVEYSEDASTKLKEHGCEIIKVSEMLKKENPRLIV